MADVVLVEDDDDVAFLMALFLEEDGHQVRRAPDGERGLALLSEHLPDLIVLDVEMPLLDGPGMAARMIVEDAGREQIPIILASGAVNLSAVAERVGTPYVLAKPFEPSELLALTARALEERRAPTPRKPRARVG
jgi:DNA-binding response OmpR family regulator